MSNKRMALLLAALYCLLALTPSALFSQTAGTVDGTVTDPSGAAVAGATVTMTDKATNIPLTATTNGVGRYVFVEVRPGFYDLSINKTGFRVTKLNDQKVTVGTELAINITLEVGSVAQTVEVTAVRGAQLQTENATMGSTLGGDTLLSLPNLNRDATSILTLQPATAPAVGGGDVYGGQVAGSLSDQNTYLLDGGNITSDLEGDNNYVNNGVGGMGAIPTPIESIAEFKVATSNQTADFLSSAGGQVMLETKHGTNSFHGAVYDYYQSQIFDANTWSNNRLGDPIVKFHENRFGAGVGGPMLPGKHLGGKTYFYGFYEGRRYPGTATVEEWTVPSALMREGILQYKDASNVVHQVNLATSTVCGNGTQACDPLGIGISPLVQQMWNTYEPLPNDLSFGDTLNTQGYRAPLTLSNQTDYGLLRIDHDFGEKWRFNASYRVFNDIAPSTNQIDIGGLLPGDKLGVPSAVSSNPAAPKYFVMGLTGTLTPNLINEFHLSYLLNDWGWIRQGVTDALSNVSAGIEFADSAFGCMCPVNMDTQDARNRVWDGHDWTYSDTLSWVKGTHYMQFGGTIMHIWDHHVRDDQVVAGLPELVDQLNKGTGLLTSAANRPVDLPSSLNSTWDNLYAQTLGIIGTASQLFVRGGSNFTLTGAKTFQDTDLINQYTLYFNDSWKIKPTLTLNYGLEWGTQMPPYEVNGVQDVAVDQSGTPISTQAFLQNTVNMALQGQVYNPVIGFEPIRSVGGSPKYPFNPFYGAFSPRVAVAWNPKFQSGILGRITGDGKTVVRVGYSRIYDRNNGVDLVLVPLLGYGFGQTIRCSGAGVIGGVAGCYGGSATKPSNAFRLGVNGDTGPFPAVQQSLPIPAEPGINSPAGGNISFLDPNWRPGENDEVTFGIQRELPDNMLVEVAYVGKWSRHLYQGLDLNDVPWMLTLGGQNFAKAYAALWQADHAGQTTIAPQPFFENALKGSPYCAGFVNCSDAVLANEGANGTGNITNENVYGMFQDIDSGGTCAGCTWTAFGGRPALPADLQGYNSMIGNTTLGFSNYQAGIIRLEKRTGHGLTLNANLTWSHTLGTVGINQEYTQANPSVPFNLRYDYGAAPFDTRWVFNMLGNYQLPFGQGKWMDSHNGILNRIIGGWQFAPIFQWNSGLVMETYTGSCDEFGQGNVPFCSGFVPLEGTNLSSISRSPHFNVNTGSSNIGSNGNVSSGGAGVNLFANPAAVYNEFGPVILGVNGRANDLGPLYGQHRWNLDFTIAKDTRINERMGFQFYAQFLNALNHMEFSDPGQYGSGGLNLQNPQGFGVMSSQFNTPRTVELGLRFSF